MPPSNMADTIAKIAAQHQKSIQEKYRDELVDILIKVYGGIFERSAAYINVIIIAGYASFFTIWSFTRESITEKASLTVALMMSFSVFFFASWEVFKMILGAKDIHKAVFLTSKKLPPEVFLKELESIQLDVQRKQMRLSRAWMIILMLTVPTAFGAGLILMYNFLAKLLGLPLWP